MNQGSGEIDFRMLREKQLRLVFSLLKPALRMAARFDVPVRGIVDLVRLGYYEVLAKRGLSSAAIASVFGQTPRHMRSLARRFKSDFFEAEIEVGLVREIEELVAAREPRARELVSLLPGAEPSAIDAALERLLAEGRVEECGKRLRIGQKYVVMTSEGFAQRIDALNHHLDGLYRATVQRLVHDERQTTMIKTITFSAVPAELHEYLKEVEGELRRRLADLEESAAFVGASGQRFTLGIAVAAADPDAD